MAIGAWPVPVELALRAWWRRPRSDRIGREILLENDLELPFKTVVLGAEVTVERLDLTDDDRIVVVCQRGQKRQRLSILDLPLPHPPPKGWEWIEAYRHWAR